MSNMTKTDQLILTLAALLLVVFSYFLYDDSLLFPRRDSGGMEQIGSVYFSSNDVRLKSATAFTWFPAQKTDSVHLLDSVFTGERSTAAIQLKDGTVLSLKENSLVTLNMKDGQMSLDLRYGDLASKLSGKGSLTITAGGKSFELEGNGSIRLNKTSGGEIDLSLIDGSARLKDGQGSRNLTPGMSLSYDSRGQDRKVVPGKINLVTPDKSFAMRVTPDAPVSLEWKSEGPIVGYELDLCKTESCDNLLKTHSVKEQQLSLNEPLPDGKYFWRVRGMDKYNRVSARSVTRSFEVAVAAPPKITTPGGNPALVQGKITTLKPNDPLTAGVKVSWTTNPLFKAYEYQIATDDQFTKPMHQASLETGETVTPKVPNGLYSYRVRGVLKNGVATGWSSVAQFQMDLTADLAEKPGTPKLDQAVYNFDLKEEKKRSPASNPQPGFAWSKVPNAKSYKVEIAKDASFAGRKSFNVQGESMTWPNYAPGKWHVRVLAVASTGIASRPSAPSELNVIVGDPVMSPVKPLVIRGNETMTSAPSAEFSTEWSPIAGAASYLLQISDTPGFEAPQQVQMPASQTKFSVPTPGSYHFRVQALDAANQPVTGFSNAEVGVYEFKNPIAAPKLTEPFDKTSIFLQTTLEPFIWLEWKKTPDTASYEVEVATDAQFTKILVRSKVVENRFLLQQQIPIGKLHWRVRAITNDTGKISDWSPSREFIIYSKSDEAFVQ